jgi:tetratricopeptide (TPR) repeat protein
MEIARDLIAAGKPRTALELLSANHDALADDPAYLLICSEAWWADGDSLRAQQALLGAARLAPEDPTPLLLLGEMLQADGQYEKAERVLDKARALGASLRESVPEMPEQADDLIAFAEQQERKSLAWLTPKQILLAGLAVATVAGVVVAIAALTGPSAERSEEATAAPVEREVEARLEPAEPADEAILAPTPSAEVQGETPATAMMAVEPAYVASPLQEAEPAPALELVQQAEPEPEPTPIKTKPKPAPRTSPKPAVKATSTRSPKPSPRSDVNAAPDATTVNAELASLAPEQLTDRADSLHAQGHTAIAASYYRRALDLDPDYAPALVGIGRSILRAEKYSEAFVNATRALQLARGVDARAGLEAEAIYQLGRVHLHRGELDAARRLFRQSISLSGTPSAAWFYLGEALWTDNSPAARVAYQKYLDLVSTGHLADRARRAIR